MKHAWENVLELNLSIDRVESNPQLCRSFRRTKWWC